MAIPVSELQSIAPSSIIELFILQLNALQHGVTDVYRFHSGSNLKNTGNVVWDGNTYLQMPIEAEGFEYNGSGQLPRPKLRVSNIFGTITAVLLSLPSGLGGAKLIRVRTLARYLDGVNFPSNTNPYGTPDPTAEFPREIYYIDRKSLETRDLIEFELSSAFDLQGVRIPKRQCVSNICQWVYRGPECGYMDDIYYKADDTITTNASQDVCGKRVSSCEKRFNAILRSGSVVTGSTTLTLGNTAGLQAGVAGYPISGFGVPSGTIISSITNSTTLVMSAAATATSEVTRNGTVSLTANTMTVTSAVGLGVGMTVAGLNILDGTTISAISGTTLTLSERPCVARRTGSLRYQFYVPVGIVLSGVDVSNIVIGMKAFGYGNLGDRMVIGIYGNDILMESTSSADYGLDASRATLYFSPTTTTQSSYSFTGSPTYKFRPDTTMLPFGSFPGAGQFA